MQKILILLAVSAVVAGCEPDLSDDVIPWQPFDVININLNLPEYVHMNADGSFMYLNNEGVRGIILYHRSGSSYVAYERNCSYQPNSASATVEVHSSSLFMICTGCNSSFDFATGHPMGGIAWRPLNRYATSLNGSTLTITDEIVE
jgi:nitrite reductase/ring-hydroxylating ferredoxin subunit